MRRMIVRNDHDRCGSRLFGIERFGHRLLFILVTAWVHDGGAIRGRFCSITTMFANRGPFLTPSGQRCGLRVHWSNVSLKKLVHEDSVDLINVSLTCVVRGHREGAPPLGLDGRLGVSFHLIKVSLKKVGASKPTNPTRKQP